MTLRVAIPDASLTDCSDLRQKTVKAGSIARALAVFRVDSVHIYDTGMLGPEKKRDADEDACTANDTAYLLQQVDVARDQRALGDDSDGVAVLDTQLQ